MAALQKPRQTNIELLRVIAMFMVVVLHCNGGGENLALTDPLSYNWFGVWSLESLSIVAVNCYILISGYFLVTATFRWRKFFSIWLQVLFYSVVAYFVIGLLYGWGTFIDLIYSVSPILNRSYWFATTYMALLAIFPFINIAIRAMTKEQLQYFIILLLIIFSVCPSIVYPFAPSTIDSTHGHGIIWFVVLYVVAAYIRLYNPLKNNYKKLYILGYLGVIVFTISCFILNKIIYFPWADVLLYYNGIGVFVASLCLFLYFLSIKIVNLGVNKIIVKLSSLTFGVYLIHENFLVREHLYTDWLNMPSYVNTQYQVLYIITCALGIYIISSLIEYLRQKLFLILRIDILMQKLDTRITKHISRFKAYL